MSRNNDERPGIGPIGGRGFSGALGGGLARLEREERRAATAGATQGRAHLGLRLSVISGLVVALMCVLLVRLWSVQVIHHSAYRNGALSELYKYVYTPAPRGEIVASGGQLLATDSSEEVVTIEPALGEQNGKLTWIAAHPEGEANLAALLGISQSSIGAELNSPQNVPHQPVVVAIGVSEQAVVQITENPARYPGVSVSPEYVRDYPQGALAAQVVGYTGSGPATVTDAQGNAVQSPLDLAEYDKYGVGSDPTFGQQGLEQEYQGYLFGVPGTEKEAVDPSGDVLGVVSTKPAVQGDTVVLNMNLGLEQSLCNDLANQVATLRAGSPGNPPVPAPDAAAVVLNVHTGAVLAVCSDPSYDDNDWVGGISSKQYHQLQSAYGSPLNDYAVADPQPPGSDFKIASATAALDDGLITPYTYFDDTGSYTVDGNTLHDNEDDGVLEDPGEVDVTSAITQSSDDFFYWVGASFWLDYANEATHPYGPTPIQDVAHEYGLGVSDGIDLPADDVATGQIDGPTWREETGQGASWYVGDNEEMAFGQGETEITPLELAVAYATFADGGVRHAPELANEVVNPSGKVVTTIAPQVTGHVDYASAADYDAMLQGFDGVTQQKTGTGYQAFQGFNFAKWNVAGKTGTATTNDAQPTSWFVAFGGPSNETPQYVVAVQVNQGGYGATASAPIAREVFNYLYKNGIHPATPAP
jgi:penicillin-binding protein 2